MLIAHATLLTLDPAWGVIQDGALRIEKGLIVEIGPSERLATGQQCLDAEGMLVMPGFVDGHGHSTHALVRGSLGGAQRGLWYEYETKLDYGALRVAALLRAVEAIRMGTTALIDQIGAPNCIPLALDAVAEAYQQAGLRACLSVGVSQEHSNSAAQAAIDENARFGARVREEPLLAGIMGIDTCLRISDQVLGAALRAAALTGLGYHINLGAYPGELRDGRLEYERSSVVRLKRLGMLGPRTLLALHERLPEDDLIVLQDTGTFLVHGVRSALAAGLLGRLLPPDFYDEWRRRMPTMLGSDDGLPDMLDEVQSAYRLAVNLPGIHAFGALREQLAEALQSGARFVGGLFRHKQGMLTPGAVADLIMLRYPEARQVTTANWPQHLLWGLSASQVDTTMVQGSMLMRQRKLITLDEGRILRQVDETVARLRA